VDTVQNKQFLSSKMEGPVARAASLHAIAVSEMLVVAAGSVSLQRPVFHIVSYERDVSQRGACFVQAWFRL